MTPEHTRRLRRLLHAYATGEREAGDHPAYTVYSWVLGLAVYGASVTTVISQRATETAHQGTTLVLVTLAVLAPLAWLATVRWLGALRLSRPEWTWVGQAPIDLPTWLAPTRRTTLIYAALVHALVGGWCAGLLAPSVGLSVPVAAAMGAVALALVGLAVTWPHATTSALQGTPTHVLLHRGDRYDALTGSAAMLDGTALVALTQTQRQEHAAPHTSRPLTGTALRACASAAWRMTARQARPALITAVTTWMGALCVLVLLPGFIAWPLAACLLAVAMSAVSPLAQSAVRSPLLAPAYALPAAHLVLVGLLPGASLGLVWALLASVVAGGPWWGFAVLTCAGLAVTLARLPAPDPSNDANATYNNMGVIMPMGLIQRVACGVPSAVIACLPLVITGPATLPLLAPAVVAFAWSRLWAKHNRH